MGQDNHSEGPPREPDQPAAHGPEDDDARPPSDAPGIPPTPQWGPPGQQPPHPQQWGPPGQQPPHPQQWGPPGQQPPHPQQWGPPDQQPPQWGPPGQQQNPWDRQGTQWGTPHPSPPGPPNQPWGAPGYLQQGGWTPPPKPGVIPLRPLGLGELLDGAFQACRKNPAATFGTALLIQAVISLLTFLVAGGLLSTAVFSTDFDTAEFEASGSDVAWSLTGLTLLSVVSVIGVLLLQGVLVVPLARSILNLKTGFAQTWKLCRSRLLALAGLGLLLTAMVIVGLALFSVLLAIIISLLGPAGIPVVIVGVLALVAVFAWLTVRLALAPAALVLEPAGIFAALRRSWILTRRNFWRSFGILALTALLVSIVSSVISAPVSLILSLATAFGSGSDGNMGATIGLVALNIAITTFFSAIGYAFQAAVTSLLYVDLRMRREGFDLALMKDQELAGTTADLVPGRRSGGLGRTNRSGNDGGRNDRSGNDRGTGG